MWDWESIEIDDDAENKMILKPYEELLKDRQDTEDFETVSSVVQVRAMILVYKYKFRLVMNK